MRLPWRRRGEDAPSSGVMGLLHAYSPDAASGPSLQQQLAVFRQARTAQDELPDEARGTLSAIDKPDDVDANSEEALIAHEPTWLERLLLVGPSLRQRTELDLETKALFDDLGRRAREDQGSHVTSESRLVLSRLGKDERRLFAVPTTAGQVGLYLIGPEPAQIGGHVVGRLPDGIDWQIQFRRKDERGYSWVAYGLVENGVEAVDLELGKDSVAAVVGRNAFFYEGEGQDPHAVTAFQLRLDDDTVRRVETDRS
jgi:hypothetical protein